MRFKFAAAVAVPMFLILAGGARVATAQAPSDPCALVTAAQVSTALAGLTDVIVSTVRLKPDTTRDWNGHYRGWNGHYRDWNGHYRGWNRLRRSLSKIRNRHS